MDVDVGAAAAAAAAVGGTADTEAVAKVVEGL